MRKPKKPRKAARRKLKRLLAVELGEPIGVCDLFECESAELNKWAAPLVLRSPFNMPLAAASACAARAVAKMWGTRLFTVQAVTHMACELVHEPEGARMGASFLVISDKHGEYEVLLKPASRFADTATMWIASVEIE